MRLCKESDFVGAEEVFRRMDSEYPGTLLCPDNIRDLKMRNRFSDPKFRQRIYMMIDKCTGGGCKNEDEMQSFFSEFYIEFNYISDQIDLTKYDKKPVIRTQKLSSYVQMNVN